MQHRHGHILKVGIVDDSLLIRQLIRQIVSESPDMEVVGEAADPYEARAMIKDVNPDVITLDIEMPKMNGLEFLEKIMRLRPMPVLMVSTLTKKGAFATLKALEIGAIDYIAKPEMGLTQDAVMMQFKNELLAKLNMARHIDMTKAAHILSGDAKAARPHQSLKKTQHYDLIVLASSTGGVERLRHLIAEQKTDLPPMLVVQHINHKFVPSMVERMVSIAPPHIDVKVAEDLVFVKPNTIYFANNEKHLTVVSKAGRLSLRLVEAPPRNGFIASADYLFESAAQVKLKSDKKMDVLGVILSGMGNDGAKGALQLKNTDINVIGENQESCLVYGMSKAAKELGAVKDEFSIQRISYILNNELMLV